MVHVPESEILWEDTASCDCAGPAAKGAFGAGSLLSRGLGDAGMRVFTQRQTLAWFGVSALLYINILVLRRYRIPISPSWECETASLEQFHLLLTNVANERCQHFLCRGRALQAEYGAAAQLSFLAYPALSQSRSTFEDKSVGSSRCLCLVYPHPTESRLRSSKLSIQHLV